MLEKYLNNNLEKPKFLFHGSPKALDVIVPRQAHDSNSNLENEDFAVFLTSSFIIASAYAFKDKVKELSRDLDWSFEIGGDVTGEVNIDFNNVRVQDDLYGYIYVFDYDDSYEHYGNSIQYKCHKDIKPVDAVKVKFSDFKDFYVINQRNKQL